MQYESRTKDILKGLSDFIESVGRGSAFCLALLYDNI